MTGRIAALLARERKVFDRYARDLATVIAEDIGAEPGDVVCRVVANTLLGLHRALIDYVRDQALAGAPASQIREGVLLPVGLFGDVLGFLAVAIRAAGYWRSVRSPSELLADRCCRW